MISDDMPSARPPDLLAIPLHVGRLICVMDHEGKSSIGLEEGIVAAGTYFGFVGLLMLMIEKKSHFVRFHAVQSTLGFLLLLGFYFIIKWLHLRYIWWAPGLSAFCFSLYMMARAYYGEEYKLPIIGSLAFAAIYDTAPETDDLHTLPPASDAAKPADRR